MERENGQLTSETFWALKDVSFEVKKGRKVVGIIRTQRKRANEHFAKDSISRITEADIWRRRTIYGTALERFLEVRETRFFIPKLTGPRKIIFMNRRDPSA